VAVIVRVDLELEASWRPAEPVAATLDVAVMVRVSVSEKVLVMTIVWTLVKVDVETEVMAEVTTPSVPVVAGSADWTAGAEVGAEKPVPAVPVPVKTPVPGTKVVAGEREVVGSAVTLEVDEVAVAASSVDEEASVEEGAAVEEAEAEDATAELELPELAPLQTVGPGMS